MAAAHLGKPLTAFGTVIPAMTIIAFASYLAFLHFGRRL
jgi:hypothetical protein